MVNEAYSPGQIINGRYTIESVLGEGNFGVVWRARDENIRGRLVAVKLLREAYVHDPQIVGRFQAEARALELLRHPAIVAALDHGVWQERPFLIMEYIDGVTLAAWLRERRANGAPAPLDVVRRLIDELCTAVAAAHEVKAPGPIVHRDLKPSNVMLRGAGAPSTLTVLDFGIAQLGARNGTQSGARMGTPTYMAPEQAMGNVAIVGTWSDVFSLAVMLFEMLTLRAAPAENDTFWGVALRGAAYLESAMAPWRGHIPDPIFGVLMHALQLDPRQRIANAHDLRERLRAAWAVLDGVPRARPFMPATQPMLVVPGAAPPGAVPGAPPLPQNSMTPPVVPLYAPGFATPVAPPPGAYPPAITAPTAAASQQGNGLPVNAQGWRQNASLSRNRAFVPSTSTERAGPGRGAWAGSIAAALCGVVAFVGLVVRMAGGAGIVAPRDCDHGGVEACLQDGIRFSDGPVTARDDARALRVLRVACNARIAEGCFRTGRALEQGRGAARDYARAVSDYGVACDQNHKLACTRLAGMLLAGRGAQRNDARAHSLLTRACDQGEMQACNDLGDLYRDGRGVAQDFARALELHQRSCTGGNMEGCDSVGMAYRDGTGVPVDPPRAVQLFQSACAGGNMEACGDQGDMVFEGRGVERNARHGIELIQRACDGGYDQGCAQLGQLYAGGVEVQRDEATAVTYFQRACDHDWGAGCNYLGNAYYEGRGVLQDRQRAAGLFRRACDADWMWGCHNLAICYDGGEGVPRAREQALPLWQRACEGGLGVACGRLGAMSRDGVGVPQSHEAAYRYYARGCEGGARHQQSDGGACNEACFMAQHSDGATVEVSVTLGWCQRACDLEAQYCNNLAYMYEIGSGVVRDANHAATLYGRACEADPANATACRNLAGLYLDGRGVRQSRPEAIRLYRRACQLGHTESCNLLRQAGLSTR